jgi:predicted nucleotidyltransferase
MSASLKNLVCRTCYGTFPAANILQDFRGRIPKEYEDAILSMTLFGSYARNEQTEDSDMDVCVIYDEARADGSKLDLALGGISFDLLGIYGIDLQPLCFSSEYYKEHGDSSPLFLNIRKEGIRLC